MAISVKDGFKLIGITIIMFCAVLVCTFFLNFYLDAKSIEYLITDYDVEILYSAQLATAKFTCAISGGCLGLVAVIMLVFYIKIYIAGNAEKIGIMKAMGFSDVKIALSFLVFGVSVLLGAILGFCGGFLIMPLIYDGMTIAGLPEIKITFHPSLIVILIVLPVALFSFLTYIFALVELKRPALELLRGKCEQSSRKKGVVDRDRGFLCDICIKTVSARKSLAFFIAFACFCFSSMIQMAASMYDLSTETMGAIIFVLGVVLSVTIIFMAATSLVNANSKNISLMKAFGYTSKECLLFVFGGYHIFALIGFAVGTVYQYGILSVMVNLVYKEVWNMPDYKFNVSVFFITFAVFIVFYEAVMLFFGLKINKISLKKTMTEN